MATMDMAMTTMTIMEMEMAPGTMAAVMTTPDGSTRNGDNNRDGMGMMMMGMSM